ncbi:MAG: site-specific DNA-methyltransferase [Verrucomicrobiae bacterium]|nr:site-specific DNA-methyltransferase [Verrucomicrobiae bacterium]
MTENFNRLVTLLRELFQMDRPDLDFGIYRIMNQKRKDVSAFLENDLLPQVRQELSKVNSGGNVQAELDAAIKQLHELGVDPESSPKVKALREKLASTVNTTSLENEIYSHLYNFFRRYYKDGDFLSLRRYKKDVYAIPYEGEEVKLHWANADQYYIKSAENFRDYAFLVGEAPTEGQEDARKRVHFKLVDADTEVANNKAQEGKERRFMLCDDTPMLEEDGELIIRFEYKPTAKKQNQKSLNEAAVRTILGNASFVEWVRLLAQEDNGRSCLEKHLNIYTARNTFDYFIHKNLGGFLRRELDFYIKNEVLFLDDIESQTAAHVEGQLTQIRVLRRIAHKIIRFLEQIESFQKKLWLKKKFVVETNYLITLDQVPEELYPEIATNDAQREEWVRLFAIDEIKKEMMKPGYSVPLTVEFLEANEKLLIDTRFFDGEFKVRLLGAIDDIDGQCDGLLIHSENFQALQLLTAKYTNKIQAIYIDPPYNTDASSIIYKNEYKNSSWISLIHDRLKSASNFLKETGIICFAIDDEEASYSNIIISSIFEKIIGTACVRSNPQSRKTKGTFSPTHEYAFFYGKSLCASPGSLDITDQRLARYPLKDTLGCFAWMNFIRTGNNDKREDRPKLFYPIYVDETNNIRIPKMIWNEKNREYEVLENLKNNEFAVYPVSFAEGRKIEKRWHRGFERVISEPEEYRARIDSSGRINIDFKTRMDEQATPKTWWDDSEYASANYGALELKELFGIKPFDFPKAKKLVQDCMKACNIHDGDVVFDFFAGSGTTGHAAINLNRNGYDKIKYILAEMGDYFSEVLKPRIAKAVYSNSWQDGKPTARQTGSSHFCRYLRLESYEDTLNNLEFVESQTRLGMLAASSALKEEYMLSYMMDLESQGSASLLNVDAFSAPWNYTLKISNGSAGETMARPVDLVETFNYLLGLNVIRRNVIRGIEVVEGTNPEGEKVLVIWRNTTEVSNVQLNEFFRKQEFNPRDTEFDLIYVNGDNNLENLKRADETWKVRLTEEEFKRLMFDVEDV